LRRAAAREERQALVVVVLGHVRARVAARLPRARLRRRRLAVVLHAGAPLRARAARNRVQDAREGERFAALGVHVRARRRAAAARAALVVAHALDALVRRPAVRRRAAALRVGLALHAASLIAHARRAFGVDLARATLLRRAVADLAEAVRVRLARDARLRRDV